MRADVAQSVERILGKDEVASSNLAISLRMPAKMQAFSFTFFRMRSNSVSLVFDAIINSKQHLTEQNRIELRFPLRHIAASVYTPGMCSPIDFWFRIAKSILSTLQKSQVNPKSSHFSVLTHNRFLSVFALKMKLYAEKSTVF